MCNSASRGKISVIVPVYNVEQYLERCVRSVISQTYSNLEILLVDDGATDCSGTICDELAREDSRIQVIHKPNGGLSSARNAGLNGASGDYVFFLDSDDWLEADGLDQLVRRMEKEQVDFVRFRMAYAGFPDQKDGTLYHFEPARQLQDGLYSRQKIEEEILPRMFTTPQMTMGPIVGVMSSLYRRALLEDNHLRFYEDIRFSEDMNFSANVLIHCNSFYCDNQVHVYNYFYNPSSISRSFRKDRWDSCKQIIRHFSQDFGEDSPYRDDQQLERLKWFCVLMGLNESKYLPKGKVRREYLISVLKDKEFPDLFLKRDGLEISRKMYLQMILIRIAHEWLRQK